MQTNLESQFSLGLEEKQPVREIELESEAKKTDVSLNIIEKILNAFKVEDDIDLARLKKQWNVLNVFRKKEPNSNS